MAGLSESRSFVWLDRLGLNALARQLRPRPLLLAYPRLCDERADPEGFPLALFRRQLAILHTAGFRFVGMDEFAEAVAGPRPGRLVTLAFTGGLRSTVTLAYPAMRVLGARGILYVVPEEVPLQSLPWGAGPTARASWGELRALDPAVLAVGNHGRSSLDCAGLLGEQEIEREIWRIGLDIEQQLGYPVRHFACPPGGEGLYDPARLEDFGYRSVMVPTRGAQSVGRDPFALRRLEPAWALPRFKAQISGTLGWVERGGAAPPAQKAAPAAPPPPAPARARAAAASAEAQRGPEAREAVTREGTGAGEEALPRRASDQSRR